MTDGRWKSVENDIVFQTQRATPLSMSWASWGSLEMRAEQPCRIEGADEERLRAVWNAAIARGEHDQVSLALRRWSSALERRHWEDRIIDYWVALDALFGSDRYRATLRLAHFIGTGADERKDVRRVADESSKLRNRVVHGGRPGRGGANFVRDQELVFETRHLVRRAVLKALTSPESFRPDQTEDDLLSR